MSVYEFSSGNSLEDALEMRYLCGTLHHGPSLSLVQLNLSVGFIDVEWVYDRDDHRSTTGFCLYNWF